MKNLKYKYLKVIQQNDGSGWEDNSYYETNSQFIAIEISNKLSPNGRKETLLSADLRAYRLTGYPTRVISRKKLNK